MAKIEEGRVIISTTSGTTALVTPLREAPELETPAAEQLAGGLIYTTLRDMPSLEELLADYQVATAVIFEKAEWPLHPLRIVAATAVASVTTAVGAVLIAVDLAAAAHPNPYISLMLFLGGIGLFVTMLSGFRWRGKTWTK